MSDAGSAIFNNHITASGAISSSGKTILGTRKFEKTQNKVVSTITPHQGDVVYFGGTTSMVAGGIYHYKSDGTWELADASSAVTGDGLLGVSIGNSSDTDGVLLRGTITLATDPGSLGDVLFLSETAGRATATAPSTAEAIVRVIGYCLDTNNAQIWFNPDGTFIEIAES